MEPLNAEEYMGLWHGQPFSHMNVTPDEVLRMVGSSLDEFRASPVVAKFNRLVRSMPLDTDGWAALSAMVESEMAPRLLWDVWQRNGLDSDALPWAVPQAWSRDHRGLSRDQWLALFRAAGFTVHGVPALLPHDPLRLYRGSGWFERRGMAWTTNVRIAAWFAHKWEHETHPAVVTTLAPPRALLAIIGGDHDRLEEEVVIDPKGLRIDRYLEPVKALDPKSVA